MASNIDATQPPATNPTTAAMRANMLAAKTEIELLQSNVGNLRINPTTLQLERWNAATGAYVGMCGPTAIKKPTGAQLRVRLRASNEAGSAGTYHTTFVAAGDFYGVQPIINVTRTPTDATYTADDVYAQIGVAPSATILTGGYPDASGGAAAWTSSANMTFARNVNAAPTTPVPVVGSLIYCSSIPRTDGGPGRILMARANATATASTRMPTYFDEAQTASARWDDANTGFPLSGMGQYYYRSGNYASTAQDTFGNGATRWGHTCFVGMKFLYSKPMLSVLFTGDSVTGGDYDEATSPIRASMGFRAGYDLQVAGYPIDVMNAGCSGYRWNQFGPYLQALVPQILPDVVVLPIFTVNGTETGVATGNTQADADKQWARAMFYRDWCLSNGVKDVLFVTPAPKSTMSVVIPSLIARLLASGFSYADVNSVLSDGNSYTWKAGYSTDGTHPLAVANIAAKEVIKTALKWYF